MGMTAHVVYTAWDPDRPASLSPIVIGDIIRGRIGFDGFLMSDDIGMEALAGDFGSRAAGVVAAGCDAALHCSGKMDEMVAVAAAVPPMSAEGEARLARAMAATMLDGGGLDFAEGNRQARRACSRRLSRCGRFASPGSEPRGFRGAAGSPVG